jgi:hypothetical protein
VSKGVVIWLVAFRNLNLPKMTNFKSTEMLRAATTAFHFGDSPLSFRVSAATLILKSCDHT